MLKKEYEVLMQFVKAPWKKFTFKEIKKLSGKKSESYVYNVLKRFVKHGILKEEKAGNVVLYFLYLRSLKAQGYAGFVSEYISWNEKYIPHKELDNIAHKIPSAFYTLIITGSYATKTHRKDSDIDIAIIADDCTEPKKIYAELRHDCEMSIPQIHLYVFKKSEFLAMLLDKKANYGKEAVRDNLILFGGQNYFNIMGEAMSNGFNG